MKDIVRVSLLTFFTSMICSSLYTQSEILSISKRFEKSTVNISQKNSDLLVVEINNLSLRIDTIFYGKGAAGIGRIESVTDFYLEDGKFLMLYPIDPQLFFTFLSKNPLTGRWGMGRSGQVCLLYSPGHNYCEWEVIDISTILVKQNGRMKHLNINYDNITYSFSEEIE